MISNYQQVEEMREKLGGLDCSPIKRSRANTGNEYEDLSDPNISPIKRPQESMRRLKIRPQILRVCFHEFYLFKKTPLYLLIFLTIGTLNFYCSFDYITKLIILQRKAKIKKFRPLFTNFTSQSTSTMTEIQKEEPPSQETLVAVLVKLVKEDRQRMVSKLEPSLLRGCIAGKICYPSNISMCSLNGVSADDLFPSAIHVHHLDAN